MLQAGPLHPAQPPPLVLPQSPLQVHSLWKHHCRSRCADPGIHPAWSPVLSHLVCWAHQAGSWDPGPLRDLFPVAHWERRGRRDLGAAVGPASPGPPQTCSQLGPIPLCVRMCVNVDVCVREGVKRGTQIHELLDMSNRHTQQTTKINLVKIPKLSLRMETYYFIWFQQKRAIKLPIHILFIPLYSMTWIFKAIKIHCFHCWMINCVYGHSALSRVTLTRWQN